MLLILNGKIDCWVLFFLRENFIGMDYIVLWIELEKILVVMWELVLGLEWVGVLDYFFELGGDFIKLI